MHRLWWFRTPVALAAMAGAVLAAALGGCGPGARGLSLDKPAARESLVAFLEAWKQGRPPAEFKEQSPEVVVRDPDWESGQKLVSYRVVEDQADDGTNLHPSVELVLRDERGRTRNQKITYVVGTDPVVTIFRR